MAHIQRQSLLARITGFPARSRQVALFVATLAVFGDVMLLGVEWASGSLVVGRGALLDGWDILKTATVSGMLLWVSVRQRSLAIGVLGAVFGLIGFEDLLGWHGQLALDLSGQFQLTALADLFHASEQAIGELLILTTLTLLGAVIILVAPELRPQLRRARWTLVGSLVVLAVFAIGVDFIAAASGNVGWAPLVEELGERLALSAAVGVSAGLVAMPEASLGFGRSTGRDSILDVDSEVG